MAKVPERARSLMSHGRVMALATATSDGDPNVVPMQQCWWYDEDTMVIGDFFMRRTRENVQQNGRASFTAWSDEPTRGYKFTGAAEYCTDGPEYDFANNEMHKRLPDKNFKGVVVVRVEKVFDIKSGPDAGIEITGE